MRRAATSLTCIYWNICADRKVFRKLPNQILRLTLANLILRWQILTNLPVYISMQILRIWSSSSTLISQFEIRASVRRDGWGACWIFIAKATWKWNGNCIQSQSFCSHLLCDLFFVFFSRLLMQCKRLHCIPRDFCLTSCVAWIRLYYINNWIRKVLIFLSSFKYFMK